MTSIKEIAQNLLNNMEPGEREDFEISLALEPDYDVVDCDCGHTVFIGEAADLGNGTTACIDCYENAKSAFESRQQEE